MAEAAAEEGRVVAGTTGPAATDPGGGLATRPDPDDPALWEEGSYVEHDGERFRVADGMGAWPLLQYAKVASMGADSDTLDGMVAVFDLAKDAIDARDFRRFGEHCNSHKLGGEAVMLLVWQAVDRAGTRPTGSPSASPGGPANTSPNLSATSTRPASSPSTPENGNGNGILQRENFPTEEGWTVYLESLNYAERKRALGIVPIDADIEAFDGAGR
jgi:hypothetical protein